MKTGPHTTAGTRRWGTVAPTFPLTSLAPVEVFSIEDTRAQVTWRRLPAGTLSATVDGREIVLGDAARPGAADIDGLGPETTTAVDLHVDGRLVASRRFRTEPALEGQPLSRIATISDLHLGETGFGLLKPMRDPATTIDGYPLRCARAAVQEAADWGAELLVIKGDITHGGRPEQWEILDELLAGITIPVVAIPGNHDTVGKRHSLDATTELQARGLFPHPVQSLDVDGARIVVADSTVPGHSFGRLRARLDDICEALDSTVPSLVFMHHHLEAAWMPTFWPLGVRHHHSRHALDRMIEVNPDLLVSSGHTHRNRVRRHASSVVTEVSSTKDHPGVWAGYVVHSNGVRQVLRRVARPDCIEWTDRTHAAVGGIWGRWSPGRPADRSVTHRWTGGSPDQEPVRSSRAAATSLVSWLASSSMPANFRSLRRNSTNSIAISSP